MTETNHAYLRYWYLHELCMLRASVAVGSTTAANALRERRALQRKLLEVRRSRPGYVPSTRPVRAKQTAKAKAPVAKQPAAVKPGNKGEILLAMLRAGATIDAICKATGWLPHSAGARISGVKKTHKVVKEGNVLRIEA